jgi:hypothetical protein
MKETNGGSELTIKSGTSYNHLLISVSDTGVGLPLSREKKSSRHSLRPKIRAWYGAAHQRVDY